MHVDFKFHPLEKVIVKSLGLEYEGFVQRCILDVSVKIYDVEYSADGQFLRREFFEEQLKEYT